MMDEVTKDQADIVRIEWCPYCGQGFQAPIPVHYIEAFRDTLGPWPCFGSPIEED